ncbi:hypothetical protein NC652_018473 [Populus alba x Populus x berolinensis]|nr:hypothetical protein NC652_018473 [Populus alba x Populus x berolinensis]
MVIIGQGCHSHKEKCPLLITMMVSALETHMGSPKLVRNLWYLARERAHHAAHVYNLANFEKLRMPLNSLGRLVHAMERHFQKRNNLALAKGYD